MTDEKQAVKTLAEQLVKAMKSVSANTPSKNYSGGTSPSTIQASKIIGLPAAFSSIISGVESSAAGGDAIAQQTLVALNHIAAGEFETITADTAMIEKVYATFGDFITLVAEDAQIGSLDVDTIRAGLAEVGLLNIGTASIDMAQIKRSSTQTAFIHESVQGKVYIDDLAVNDASIVNLAAGTVLINDTNGELVELYVDDQGNVSTRAVAYDGSDIINQNSLNGNRIVQNSITTTQLNANEIFAAQGTIMDLIADNIEATRLFANQGFIAELQSTIISSDLSENSTIIELTDSINLFASNTSRTFIQENMPIPVHTSDTWFDPSTEEHYVANAVYLPISQMMFGHDDGGNLNNEHSNDYQFSINSNGELMLLITAEEAGEIILENDIDFEIVNDRLYANGLWRKVDNIAFSNLRVSVDGITSEVTQIQYNILENTTDIAKNATDIAKNTVKITQNTSRIDQNADSIALTVQSIESIEDGTTAIPYVETSSIKIKDNKVEIKSTGDVDIKADKFSISFNTSGTASNKNRVDISNSLGIKVSDQYGGYFQATYNKLGLYDSAGNAKLYMNSEGNAVFTGNITGGTINGASLTLGGANNGSGQLVVNNASDSKVVELNNRGITVYKGNAKQFYVDDSGNATFAGSLSAATGSFAGTMSAACITSGTLSADRIGANTISVGKLTGSITNNGWTLNLTDGTFTIGNISASNVTSGTMSAARIKGGTLTLGGADNGNGSLVVNNASDSKVVELNNRGITVYKGNAKQFYVDDSGNAVFKGSLDAATGSFSGTVQASKIEGTKSLGNNWSIDFTDGSMTIGNINASKITTGTMSAARIKGGTLTLGGADNGNGTLIVKDTTDTIATIDNSGVNIQKGNIVLSNPYYIRVEASKAVYSNGHYTELGNNGFKVHLQNNDITTRYYSSINQSASASFPSGSTVYYPLRMSYLKGNTSWDNDISPFGTRIYKEYNDNKMWEAKYNVSEVVMRAGKRSSEGGWETGDKYFEIYIDNSKYNDQMNFSGTKSRIVSTDQYFNRLLYCYETPSPMFGDIGEGVISEDGKCYIMFDPIFAQTISTNNYQVFLQKYGDGDCYISERHGSYFVVCGTPNTSFGWELKAKQYDYDQLRLEKHEPKFVVSAQTYGEDAANHIQELYNERTEQSNQESEE